MGHDLHSARAGVDLSGRPGDGAVAGLAGMGAVWRALGSGSAGQSHDAVVSAILRAVGMVAEIPARTAVARRRGAFLIRVLSRAFALAVAKL